MSNTNASEIVNKVWNYAHVLRDDGVGYGDYVEQITFLIFLKMADEREVSGQQVAVPDKITAGQSWSSSTVMTWKFNTAIPSKSWAKKLVC